MAEHEGPPLEARVAPRSTALVIVDMQNDFIVPAGAHVEFAKRPHRIDSGELRSGEQLAPGYARMPSVVRANQRLVEAARRAGVSVVWVRIENTPETQARFWRSEGLACCLPGTPGAELVAGLVPESGDLAVVKRRHSAFFGTELETILRARGIAGLVVTGVGTPGCVEATVRDAMMRDYWVVVPGDACGSGDIEVHEAALHRIDRLFGWVTDTDRVIRAWETATA